MIVMNRKLEQDRAQMESKRRLLHRLRSIQTHGARTFSRDGCNQVCICDYFQPPNQKFSRVIMRIMIITVSMTEELGFGGFSARWCSARWFSGADDQRNQISGAFIRWLEELSCISFSAGLACWQCVAVWPCPWPLVAGLLSPAWEKDLHIHKPDRSWSQQSLITCWGRCHTTYFLLKTYSKPILRWY